MVRSSRGRTQQIWWTIARCSDQDRGDSHRDHRQPPRTLRTMHRNHVAAASRRQQALSRAWTQHTMPMPLASESSTGHGLRDQHFHRKRGGGTSCSMVRATIRPTPLVLRRKANSWSRLARALTSPRRHACRAASTSFRQRRTSEVGIRSSNRSPSAEGDQRRAINVVQAASAVKE